MYTLPAAEIEWNNNPMCSYIHACVLVYMHAYIDREWHRSIIILYSLCTHTHVSMTVQYRPLTPSSPKHSPLGMARLIPFTALLAGLILQVLRQEE